MGMPAIRPAKTRYWPDIYARRALSTRTSAARPARLNSAAVADVWLYPAFVFKVSNVRAQPR